MAETLRRSSLGSLTRGSLFKIVDDLPLHHIPAKYPCQNTVSSDFPENNVCDSSLRIPLDSNIVRTAKEIPTIVAAVSEKQEEADALREAGVQVLIAKERQGFHHNIRRLCSDKMKKHRI